jgi:hypothetical protein
MADYTHKQLVNVARKWLARRVRREGEAAEGE